MCSILGIFDIKTDVKELRTQALVMSRTHAAPRTGLERHLCE